MRTKYIMLLVFLPMLHICGQGNRDLLSQIEKYQKRVLPKKSATIEEITAYLGKPTYRQPIEYHVDGKVIRMECHSFELIEHYWLKITIHEGKVHHAHFHFNDPRVAWAQAGMKEYKTIEHAINRLSALKKLFQKHEEKEN